MTSYLSENEAKNQQDGDVHIAQIPDKYEASPTVQNMLPVGNLSMI